jgi:hypothetical protein
MWPFGDLPVTRGPAVGAQETVVGLARLQARCPPRRDGSAPQGRTPGAGAAARSVAALFTADAGANLRELMERMGHSSTRAALIYLK